MSKKNWKDYLLSSGIPLEHSVIRIFEKLGIFRPIEFRYERNIETGVRKIFSVDVYTTYLDEKRNLWIEILVECKYRNDKTKWIFMPAEYGESLRPDFSSLFVTLDEAVVERSFKRNDSIYFKRMYPLCEKGIEILPKDINPQSINHAISQLRYAIPNLAATALRHQAEDALGKPEPIFVILPIIVTTAEIWRLYPDVTIETLRDSEDLKEVASLHDIVLLHEEPDNLVSRLKSSVNDIGNIKYL